MKGHLPAGPKKASYRQGQRDANAGKVKSTNPYRSRLTRKIIAYAEAWDCGFDAYLDESAEDRTDGDH